MLYSLSMEKNPNFHCRLLTVHSHFTVTSACVRALPVRHYRLQTNRKGVVAELLDTVAKHRFVQKISVLSE